MEVDIGGMLANVEQYFKKLLYTKKKGLNMKQKENYEIFSVNVFRFCALLF